MDHLLFRRALDFPVRYPLGAHVMKSLTVVSPSKVNLDLRILGRYPNGYHRIFTLFQRLSLCDTLRLVPRQTGLVIHTRNPAVPVDERNIISRAYRLLLEKSPKLPGVSVYLKKKIPVAAGLGGGSGNAAAFLVGMNKLFSLNLTRAALMKLGGRLGADVPFFVSGASCALGTGLGDRINPLSLKAKRWFVLIVSEQGLSTQKVYQNLPKKLPAASLTKLGRTVRIATHFLDRLELEKADKILRNDLELSAFQLKPSIKRVVKKAVRLGAPLVRMSGSGPTVFAVFTSQKEAKVFARRIKQVLKKDTIVCHSI